MSRRVTDGLIIAAVLALGATHMWAQGMGGRRTVHANQGGNSRVSRGVQSNPGHGTRNLTGNGMGNGVGVNAHNFGGTAGAGQMNVNPAGPARAGAGSNPAGPSTMGAAGPAPMGAAGPAPMGAAGGATVVGGGMPAGCTNVGGGVVCR